MPILECLLLSKQYYLSMNILFVYVINSNDCNWVHVLTQRCYSPPQQLCKMSHIRRFLYAWTPSTVKGGANETTDRDRYKLMASLGSTWEDEEHAELQSVCDGVRRAVVLRLWQWNLPSRWRGGGGYRQESPEELLP